MGAGQRAEFNFGIHSLLAMWAILAACSTTCLPRVLHGVLQQYFLSSSFLGGTNFLLFIKVTWHIAIYLPITALILCCKSGRPFCSKVQGLCLEESDFDRKQVCASVNTLYRKIESASGFVHIVDLILVCMEVY